ncbi:Smr/MutS family protein [Paracoccus sp. p4-l81]|uniref:Smr/MutS family protein n=1 Tax=Paracoccus sp. p4-l81 TaxID=3342806 RepID=UPI0035B75880
MSRRKLTEGERDLWARVAATATPFHPARASLPDPAAHPLPKKPAPKSGHTAPHPAPHPGPLDFRIGSQAPGFAFRHDLAPSLAERLAHQPIRMDHKTHRQMTRGKIDPEARIDLHGMTLAQAHGALNSFVMTSHARGRRLVLVITGKGKPGPDDGPIPQRQGVLRHQVPVWLGQPPLGAMVLQITPAHLRHGGSGAYYVYLRRHG